MDTVAAADVSSVDAASEAPSDVLPQGEVPEDAVPEDALPDDAVPEDAPPEGELPEPEDGVAQSDRDDAAVAADALSGLAPGLAEGTEDFEGAESTRGVELAGEGLEPGEGGAENTEEFLKGLVEAILFTADHPLSVRDVARAARIDRPRAQELIEMLAAETKNRGVRVIEVADGFAFRTNPAYGTPVRDFLAQKPVRLSRAQLETLAIIAYRQPVTRPEVDDIRGVDSGAVLKALLERDLLRILGKKDEPGRPMIYGTTPQFLDLFSLKSLRDLPTLREFTELSEDSRAKFELELGEVAPEGPISFPTAVPPEAQADGSLAEAEGASLPAEAELPDAEEDASSDEPSDSPSESQDDVDAEEADASSADESGDDGAEGSEGEESDDGDDDDDDDDDESEEDDKERA